MALLRGQTGSLCPGSLSAYASCASEFTVPRFPLYSATESAVDVARFLSVVVFGLSHRLHPYACTCTLLFYSLFNHMHPVCVHERRAQSTLSWSSVIKRHCQKNGGDTDGSRLNLRHSRTIQDRSKNPRYQQL